MITKVDLWAEVDVRSLFIGDTTIDQEHAELFRILEKMWELAPSCDQSDSFFDLLSAIGQKIFNHFAHEEVVISKLRIPEDQARLHFLAHKEIIQQYTQLNLDILHGKVHERQRIIEMMRDWIVIHCIRHDLKLKPAITDARQKSAWIK